MSTALDLDLDLDLMVGEMPAPPCESPHHDHSEFHQGEGTHYATTGHECYGPVGPVFSICKPYAIYWQTREGVKFCHWCECRIDEDEYVEIIGAINH